MASMRAVARLSDAELADRRSKGLDRWDEVWEGVLRVTPAPTVEHQRIVDELIEFLRPLLRRTGRGALFSQINVFRETTQQPDFRIPDLTFVATGREHVLHADGIRREGPDAVIEVRSPDDETYEKLPFFAAIGVREVIVCDRDTKEPEVFRLRGSRYEAVERDAAGWLHSLVLGVRLRRVALEPARLRVVDATESSIRANI
jgi:Uma2 family endonuclease